MAEFPPNLDDGELWLPSDIFINEVVPSKYQNPYPFCCMDDFTRHLATLSLLQTHHATTNPSRSPPQRVRPAVRGISVNQLPPGGYIGVNDGQRLVHRYSNGPHLTRLDPYYEFQVQPRVTSYLETRAKILHKQQNRLQNRDYPLQASGFGGGGSGGGFVRESGGTGVFHPRIVNPTTTTTTKKQGVRNRHETQVTDQMNPMKRVGVSKQEDCYYHLPPEMGLPQDWTY